MKSSPDISGMQGRIARALARSDGIPNEASTGDYFRNAGDLLKAMPELTTIETLQSQLAQCVGALEAAPEPVKFEQDREGLLAFVRAYKEWVPKVYSTLAKLRHSGDALEGEK